MSDAYIVRRGKIIQGGGGNMQSKTVTPTASGFTVTPDSGYDGMSSVIVNGDTNLEASNIKSGINIFGVTGSYGGGGGFDPNGAVLKVVTSTGCSITVSGTGYSQTQQDGDGFPRSDDANVTEHFFSIPASAFGTITVKSTNTYGDNTKTLTIDEAGKVYELLCGGVNIILDGTFGLQSGYSLSAFWAYSDRDKNITPGFSTNEYKPVFATDIPVSAYSTITVTAGCNLSRGTFMELRDDDDRVLCGLNFSSTLVETETKSGNITNKYYPAAQLYSQLCRQITEIILR